MKKKCACLVSCQVQQQGQQQGAGGGEGTQGKPAPKPDERTWIQKNWLFLVPIGLIVSRTASCLRSITLPVPFRIHDRCLANLLLSSSQRCPRLSTFGRQFPACAAMQIFNQLGGLQAPQQGGSGGGGGGGGVS